MPKPPRRPRRSDPQLELGLTHRPSTPTAPAWNSLPAATQQALTHLLTRLLIAHADSTPQQDVRTGGPDEH